MGCPGAVLRTLAWIGAESSVPASLSCRLVFDRLIIRASAAHAHELTPAAFEELEKFPRLGAADLAPLQHRRCDFAKIADRRAERVIGALEFGHDLPIDAPTSQTDQVQTDERIALGHHAERRHIARYSGAAADHGALTDAAKLMNRRTAAQERPLIDLNVACEQHRIGDDDPIADPTIMGNMAARHQKAVGADFGVAIQLGGAADRHVLANHRARADTQPRLCLHIEAQVLRVSADDRKGVDHHALGELTVTRHVRVRVNDAAAGELGALFDDCSGMYLQLGIRLEGSRKTSPQVIPHGSYSCQDCRNA